MKKENRNSNISHSREKHVQGWNKKPLIYYYTSQGALESIERVETNKLPGIHIEMHSVERPTREHRAEPKKTVKAEVQLGRRNITMRRDAQERREDGFDFDGVVASEGVTLVCKGAKKVGNLKTPEPAELTMRSSSSDRRIQMKDYLKYVE